MPLAASTHSWKSVIDLLPRCFACIVAECDELDRTFTTHDHRAINLVSSQSTTNSFQLTLCFRVTFLRKNLANARAILLARCTLETAATSGLSTACKNDERSESCAAGLTFTVDHIRYQLASLQYSISSTALERHCRDHDGYVGILCSLASQLAFLKIDYSRLPISAHDSRSTLSRGAGLLHEAFRALLSIGKTSNDVFKHFLTE